MATPHSSTRRPPPSPEPSAIGAALLFHAAPRPEHAAPYPAWLAARRALEDALRRPGVAVLGGPPGAGKSLLLAQVAARLRGGGRTVVLMRRGTTSAPADPPPDVILIDHAGALRAALLTPLVRLGRTVAVVGDAALTKALRAEGLRPVTVALPALSRADAARFLAAQLEAARQPPTLLQPAAADALITRAGGVARELQLLAGLSVFVARLADAPQVTAAHVDQAALTRAGIAEEADEDDDPPPDLRAVLPSPAAPPVIAPARARPLARAPARPRSAARIGLAAALAAGLVVSALVLTRPAPPVPSIRVAAPATDRPAPPPTLVPPPQPAALVAPPAPPPAAPPPATTSPPPAPAPPPPPLPSTLPAHVTVAFLGRPGVAARAVALAEALRASGYPVAPPDMAPPRSEPGVQFAFAEDAPLADVLARALGLRAVQARTPGAARPGSVHVIVGSGPPDPRFDLPHRAEFTP